ncbi:MAG TPA: LuxR C-terminal-related transcriptional regulator [Rectinemataceae bacterium]|nr:LuxR C-terminal-related transcriptional regulator [Rectinemataceae bacterium]
MRLLDGPLKIWIEDEADPAGRLATRARRAGLVLAESPAEADLVARPASGPEAASARRPSRRGAEASLSGRELEMLQALVEGRSNAEIAADLGIGLRTVRFHLGSLYAKLGAGRRGEAVREGLRRGLVRFEA